MLYEKWPIQSSFWRGCNFWQSIFISQDQEIHSQEVMNLDIIGHFWKSTKTTFFSKAYNLRMEYQNEMRPKGLIRGHLKLSRKSNNISKSSKLKKLCIIEVGLFCKIAKSQLSPKLQILPNGPIIFHLIWVCIIAHVPRFIHELIFHFYYLIWFFIEFIHFKSNKIT